MRALVIALCLLSGPADAACRQALALGLDVSGSVDAREYRLQLDGLAAALGHPEVRAALLANPAAPVSLAVFEWSGPNDQRLILPWQVIDTAATLDQVRAELAATRRVTAAPSTAIGAAMGFGANLLAMQKQCWKRTLDLSGDGKSNTGPRPREVATALALRDTTINALVVGSDDAGGDDQRQPEIAELSAYFRAEVILGPDAFVETALGFDAFEAAMVRKLLRELEGLAITRLTPGSQTKSVDISNLIGPVAFDPAQ